MTINSYDERRDIAVSGDYSTTLDFCVEHFIHIAEKSIADHGYFTVALSGGSTPKDIYKRLALPKNRERINWGRCLIFWSDERPVPPDSTQSNYRMAMESGIGTLPLNPENIFRMEAERENIEEAAKEYERIIYEKVPSQSFDLVMLGLGEDGHTASLFPETHGLNTEGQLVTANFIPSQETWRMSFTFDCINKSKHPTFYVMGKNKASIIAKILTSPYEPNLLPAQRVGTPANKALWILDIDAASLVL